jgi:hypothetical protein
MLDLIMILVTGTIGVGLIGYLTPKIAIWGSIGTSMIWMTAHVIPAISPQEVLNEIGPHILDLFMVYPTAVGLAWGSQTAEAGFLGGMAVLLWAVVLFVPYVAGIVLGLLTWPELFLFRVIL